MEAWQATCARVRAIAAQLENEEGTAQERAPLVRELMGAMDTGDPLVALWALDVLRRALIRITVEASVDTDFVSRILERPTLTGVARRFQLLRHLIRVGRSEESAADASEDEDGASDEEGVTVYSVFMTSVLKELIAFEALLSTAMQDPERHCDAVHEGIICLTAIVKQSTSTNDVAELCSVVERAIQRAASWTFNKDVIPTYIACDMVDLAISSKALDQQTSTWWVTTTFILLQSPLSTLVMDRLNNTISSDTACAESFVGKSSSYPLLQKWIQLFCITMNEALSLSVCLDTLPQLDQLPPRTRLFAVLTEQDDVMINVAIELLAIDRHLESSNGAVADNVKTYFKEELHPDLVFSHILQVFRDDHLVLLDMLMASETRMLEYLLQYLRQATASWPRCLVAWSRLDRTQSVMTVLIRARMEIERLVEADVFPYDPTPLLRRLETLEELYESEDADEKT